MIKIRLLLFAFILVLLSALNSQAAEPRLLQYGSTPVYEEEYKEEVYEESPPSSYGGGGGGYGSKPVYEEQYEEKYEEKYEEQYEENYGGGYGTPPPEEQYEEKYEEQYEEKYEEQVYEESPPVYGGGGGGGYGSTPVYEEYYNEKTEYEAQETYEETGISYGESPSGYGSGTPSQGGPKWPPAFKTGFVVDIHFLSGDPNFQYIAYHFCQELYSGFSQCDIYNGTKENSKFMGSEFVVSEDIFKTLPFEERKLWHSHAFAVQNGLLVEPTVPPDQDLAAMEGVINTYGKVTDFWHSYQSFPYGGAKLAYGLGDESQIIPELADQMDQELGLKTTWRERRIARRSLQANPIVPGANDYLTSGEYPQYVVKFFEVKSVGVENQNANEEITEISEEITPEES